MGSRGGGGVSKPKCSHPGSDHALPEPALLPDFVGASKLLHVFAEVALGAVLRPSAGLTLATHPHRPFHLGALKPCVRLSALNSRNTNNALKQISSLLWIHVAFHSCTLECLECCTVCQISLAPSPSPWFSSICTLFPGRGIYLIADGIKLQCLISKDGHRWLEISHSEAIWFIFAYHLCISCNTIPEWPLPSSL